jgi:membrane protease YdiL (CAAX protease family)
MRQIVAHSAFRYWCYLLLITVAEALTVFESPSLGMVAHACLLIVLIAHGSLGRQDSGRGLMLTLTLAPLTRLLTLALAVPGLSYVLWYPVIAIPLLTAVVQIIRQVGLSRTQLGLRPGVLPLQLMLLGGGFGLGALEYNILAPESLLTVLSWRTLWLPFASLFICAGFIEELIFRGVLQAVALPALRRWALLYVSILFSVLHLGHRSLVDVVFVLGMSLLFGHLVLWGRSILGVALAHGLANIMLFVLMPFAAQHPASQLAAVLPWAIWGGTGVAIVAAGLLLRQAARAGHVRYPYRGHA